MESKVERRDREDCARERVMLDCAAPSWDDVGTLFLTLLIVLLFGLVVTSAQAGPFCEVVLC